MHKLPPPRQNSNKLRLEVEKSRARSVELALSHAAGPVDNQNGPEPYSSSRAGLYLSQPGGES